MSLIERGATIAMIATIACGSVADPTLDPTAVDESAVGAVPELLPRSFAKTTASLNLRSGPGTSYRVLLHINIKLGQFLR